MLNEAKIIASYKSIMASNKSKAQRAAALKAVPGMSQLTDRFGWLADKRHNITSVSAVLMAEIDYINAVHSIAVSIKKRNVKEARRVLYKLSASHETDFIGLTLDSIDSAINCGDYKRALVDLSEISGGAGVKLSASVEALADSIK